MTREEIEQKVILIEYSTLKIGGEEVFWVVQGRMCYKDEVGHNKHMACGGQCSYFRRNLIKERVEILRLQIKYELAKSAYERGLNVQDSQAYSTGWY